MLISPRLHERGDAGADGAVAAAAAERGTTEHGTAGARYRRARYRRRAGRTPPAYGTVVIGGGALPSLSASSGSSRAAAGRGASCA